MKKPSKLEIFKKNKKFLLRIEKQLHHKIGIDLGTNVTGLSFSNDTTISIKGEGNIIKRIDFISNKAETYIRQYNLNAIALIEDYAFAGKTVIQEAEIGGLMKNMLWRHQIPFMTIAPTTLKKFTLGKGEGKGGSKKELMLLETYKRWGVEFRENNECDAFCLRKFLESLFEYLKDENKFKKWEQQMFMDFIISRGDPIM